MKNGVACVKDTNDFINKVKNNDTPNDALLVTAVLEYPMKYVLKHLEIL